MCQHRNFIPYFVFSLKHLILRRCTIWTPVFSNHCRVFTRGKDIVFYTMAYDSVLSSEEKSVFVKRTRRLYHVKIYYEVFMVFFRIKWVPATTARCVLRLRMEERPPIWKVAANILKKLTRTADKEWSSRLVVG